MTERETDYGVWTCENCGWSKHGERGEPPLRHVHRCEGASGGELAFEEESLE